MPDDERPAEDALEALVESFASQDGSSGTVSVTLRPISRSTVIRRPRGHLA